MEKKFKTNIKCSACVEKVTPFLNNAVGEDNWTVDLNSPERTLIVQSEVHDNAVEDSLKKAGYSGEALN